MEEVKVIDYGFFNHDGLDFEYQVSTPAAPVRIRVGRIKEP